MKDIKKSISCSEIGKFRVAPQLANNTLPKAGDVGIFKVRKLGKHKALQGYHGRNITLFEGDYIMATFGNRYATVVFRGEVPVAFRDEYHILGKGGVIGIVRQTHAKAEDIGPTTLSFIGFAVDENDNILNTKYQLMPATEFERPPFKVIMSVGSSMDSGKTTTAGFLVRGLRKAGKRVAYVKFTGTVFTKDKDFVASCGADMVMDFSDVGYPSTFLCSIWELKRLYNHLMRSVAQIEPDYVVVEIADGILQQETYALLSDPEFQHTFDHVILSAGDSLGVLGGLNLLEKMGLRPFAVSGLFTASPMLVDEVKEVIQQPVLTLGDLKREQIIELFNVPKRMNNNVELLAQAG